MSVCFDFCSWLGIWVYFCSGLFDQLLILDVMDLDGDRTDSAPRELKGFRRRWNPSQASSPAQSGPSDVVLQGEQILHADNEYDASLFGGDVFGKFPGDWDVISVHDGAEQPELPEGLGKRVFENSDNMPRPSTIQVCDPQNRESQWKHAAIEADAKRLKSSFQKLPWELEGSAFKPLDRWHGTGLASFDRFFQPTFVGAYDVLESQVVKSRPSAIQVKHDLPVVPISLKRSRREPLDEDIRRKALLRLSDLILQDPLATRLGTCLRGQVELGEAHEDVQQSVRDAFRMKASSTLQKRAASLWKLAKILREFGQLHPLRVSEAQLYMALCKMRESGAGATTAQHVVEALHFLDAAATLTIVNLADVVSSRCRGVARDMFLTKDPLRQKVPLTVEQVRRLEVTMQTVGSVFRCILGQILFCIHACCRWKDGQRLKQITTESGHGETLLYADALTSKTTASVEARTRFLPYAALGSGVSSVNWADLWLEARETEGLTCNDFVLPSYSEKQACWLETQMSASEATAWLRDFLDGTTNFKPELVGSHSCKSTLLTWAGRCIKVVFTPAERRLLGHHLDPSMKSVLCYSRESFTSLYSKVLCMFRLIRTDEYNPDLSAVARVVQQADAAGENQLPGNNAGAEEQLHSDSDSSAASIETGQGDQWDGVQAEEPCVSLFPGFPGIPETDLFVHNLSGLVHVVNEDDTMLCGRSTSVNFRLYAKVLERDHLAGCRQCLKSFQNRKG